MALTKADIAQKIANDCGFMKGEAAEIVEKVLDLMKDSLVRGEDVMISGFGKWEVKYKHARRGRNPKTGEEMILDARRVVTWSYSPKLKKAVNDLWVQSWEGLARATQLSFKNVRASRSR